MLEIAQRHEEKNLKGDTVDNRSRYEKAELGFRNYWYPVTWSRVIGRQPISVKLLGEPVMFVRPQDKVHVFQDECPHRGVPLSLGRQEFPGTWTCCYHGWTYDLQTGVLRAALTDGPDSPICGKVRVHTYPVEERAGLVWVYMGGGKPPPVEDDIPEALLLPDSVIVGRITVRRGNWRYAAENGFDDAHLKYLHRYGTIRTMVKQMPAWSITRVALSEDGNWITRVPEKICYQDDYPGLGRWPKVPVQKKFSRRRGGTVSIRRPGVLRSQHPTYAHYEWYVPLDRDHHHYLQLLVSRAHGWQVPAFYLRYWLYRRWLYHVQFNNQDSRIVELTPESSPAPLFRPDISITAWRRLCEHARGETSAQASLADEIREAEIIHRLPAAE